MVAINNHTPSIADTLLEAGTNPYVTAPNGDTPLAITATRGYTDIMASLLDRPGVKEQQDFTSTTHGVTAVGTTALYRRVDIVDLLLKRGV